ncbi:FMN reductase [NAD(P)H] [Cognatiyoonia koreensis]|uniref:FMN reductase [NAD(P)H] n=1 Tax=Cognatiyoonia koreensis TaxID=364200 RepID=A0A1I0MLI2_9RHOB|nr:nitroreductase family protein [Cognatiyoonia koreensis]SEV88441.1 FMN reductase [NAD(P)H] [Cognatiyoonia koreensis]
MGQDSKLHSALHARFCDALLDVDTFSDHDLIANMAARGSCRTFRPEPVPDGWLDLLCAIAMSAPTKSDLQQRDIILLKSDAVRSELSRLVAGQDWVAKAPMIAIFCGNNRRQRLLHEIHDVPFANDHFDAVFNAAGDAAISLGAFVTAAEAMGLGCCPISAVRNESAAVSKLLGLPNHVFPFAGLAVGFPESAASISPRLPLRVTCHTDRYGEENLKEAVRDYDTSRAAALPYARQRNVETFGESADYGWSEDKVRQYSQPERADFGAYIRAIGFKLD